MTPSQQQSIINGVTVEDYEWTIYYNKLVKASKQQPEMAQEQPATPAELLAQIAESQAVTKRLLEKYKADHWLAPSLSVDAEVFTPEPEPEPEPESPPPPPPDDDMPEVFLRSPIIRAPTLADRNISHIFAPPPEPVGQEETKGSDDDSSVCSDITDETPVKVRKLWEARTVVKNINDRWKKSKKYYIAHLKNAGSGGAKTDKPAELVWGWKATRGSTDPIIGSVRIVKKNRNSVNVRYRHQHDGQQEKRCVRVRNNEDGFGDYICVETSNKIYLRQNEAGDGLDDE